MIANGASILVNPHPCGHVVYLYTDEVLVGQAVALFASAGLRGGEGVILTMSADHCESIKLWLQLEGLASDVYQRSGQLICATAEGSVSKVCPGWCSGGRHLQSDDCVPHQYSSSKRYN